MDLVPEAQRPGLTQEQVLPIRWFILVDSFLTVEFSHHESTSEDREGASLLLSCASTHSVTKIPLDVFILSFQDSMDDSDDSSKILVNVDSFP
eukprot:750024-Hanusia_phi.AAC.4